MSDLLSRFDGVPDAATATQPAQQDSGDFSRFDGVPVQVAPITQAAPMLAPGGATRKSGVVANAAAGAVEGGAGILNMLADPFGNLIGRPIVIAATTAHDVLAPMFGYEKFTPEQRAFLLGDQVPQIGTQVADAAGRALAAPRVEDVVPETMGQSAVRAGVRGGVGLLGMNLAAAPASTANAIASLGLGASGGVVGDVARQIVPPEYAPAAELTGNVLGAGIPGAGVAAGLGMKNAMMDYMRPTIGARNTLLNGSIPMMAADGTPITASANQAAIAGNRLQAAATDPAAVRVSLNELLPGGPTREIVPGAAPTTFQATRDPGLGQLERSVSRGPAAADFRARADAQNDARVRAIQSVAEGADPAAVPATIQRMAGETDAMAAQRVADLQQRATQATDAMGGNLPAGSESTLGQMLRAPLQGSLAETRKAESALWTAIDPNGTLAVDMTPVRVKANEIANGIGPNAAPPTGEEAAILATARGLPDVQSFGDLKDLRSRLTDAIRAAKQDPNRAQEARRLGLLLDGVHDTMEGSVNGQAAQDTAAVQAGTMRPEDAITSRLQAETQAFHARRRAEATGGTAGTGYSASSGSGPSGFSGASGAEVPTRGSPGPSSGSAGLQGSQSLTPNFDAEAAARYAAARQATAERVATYRSAPGVGQVLQQGPSGFRTPDATVPNIIVKIGPQGADVVRAYTAAGGSPEALTDAAAYSLRQYATRQDGTLDPARYQAWANQRSSFLSQLPEAANRFRTASEAQQAVNDAMAARADIAKQIQDSALGKFIGNADPVTQVASALRSPTAVADMGTLSRAVAGDPAAKAGLQRAVAEHILRDLKGNATGPTGTEAYLKGDQLQTFLRTREPALRQVLTPEQMTSLRNVAQSLEQSRLDTRIGTGSDTVQNAAGKGETLMARVGREIVGPGVGASLGASLGSVLGGPWGATAGATFGAAAGKAIQSAREAGIQNVDHLVAQAMLNPALARVLLTKVTPQNSPAVMSALKAQLGRLSLVVTSQSQDQRKYPQPPRNALFQ